MEAGEILLRRGLLNRGQLEQSRGIANGHGDGTKLIESAIQLGFVSEEQALKAVGEEVGIDFIDLQEAEIDLTLLKSFPQKLIYRQSLFPIRQEFGQLVVATSNPFDLYPLDEVSAATALLLEGREAGISIREATMPKFDVGLGRDRADRELECVT